MPAVVLIVAGIAAVDMVNPGTLAPALVFAVASRPVQRVTQFGLGFLLVNLVGGILLVLGPGKLLFALIPDVSTHAEHVLEVIGGSALLVAAVLLLVFRRRLVEREQAEVEQARGRARASSAFFAGAGIAAVELPTAFPYFAAIAAINAAHVGVVTAVLLVLMFNLIFLAPVFAIALVVGLFPEKRDSLVEPLRRWISQHWPQLLAGILALAGAVVLGVGVNGLA